MCQDIQYSSESTPKRPSVAIVTYREDVSILSSNTEMKGFGVGSGDAFVFSSCDNNTQNKERWLNVASF